MAPRSRLRFGVLVSADGPAREASLESGEAMAWALREAGRDAVVVHADRHLDLAVRQADVDAALLALRGASAHGPAQGLLEMLGVPYAGSSVAAASLAGDRLKTKEILRHHGIATPAFYRHTRDLGTASAQHAEFGFPCLVRPRGRDSEASFSGATAARDEVELASALEIALHGDDDVLVERPARGALLQIVLLEGQVLGAAELSPRVAARGEADAAVAGGRRRVGLAIPPRLSPVRSRSALSLAVRAHHLLGCDGVTRVELVVPQDGPEQVIDVDASPDLGATSLAARIAQAVGLSYVELVTRVADSARLHAGRRLRERRSAPVASPSPDRRTPRVADPH